MTKNYTKPIVTIDSGMAEGVYAASGATKGTLNVTYYGVQTPSNNSSSFSQKKR